jgi:predicted ATPase/DNA-binding CsgD family transcriptional regulator
VPWWGQGNEVGAIRTNLPQEANSFVGRAREIGELRQLLGKTRALTLCGAGGIGKTRLALRVLAEAEGDFPDGVCFAELGDLRQPDLVVPRVAAVIGVGEEPGRPLVDTLADALAPRKLLLAFDNCEHLIGTCALLGQRLLASSPGLRLVATSREPLRVAAETVWQVPPLSLPAAGRAGGAGDEASSEAVRLFAARAAASLPGFTLTQANVPAVAALCRALDGMPLAIELAAARVRVLSVGQIGARLTDRFALLTRGDRTGPPRQRTLRAAIDWSHELLAKPEQILLRRLSVFAGWSLEMAEQVCPDDELPERDILDVLAALVDKSLVVLEPEVLGQARYRLLDTIREYAAGHLATAGETAEFGRRLRDYTAAVAEQNHAIGMAQIPAPWSARVDVFRRFDVDAGNVWQVLSRCLEESDAEMGLRICTAVRPCWIVRGSFAEGGEWLDAFLALGAPGVPPGVRGAALVGRAQLTLPSDPVRAGSLAEAGLELCRAARDGFWTAAALNVLSEVALHTGRTAEAESFAVQALSVAQGGGDGWNEGYALGVRAALAGVHGRLREAQQLAKASIGVMRRIDQQFGAARGLLGLGDLARLRRDPGDARAQYLAALEILREIDARPEIARCLAGLGRIAMDLGAVAAAREYLTESIRISHSTGSRIGVARSMETFARLAVAEERPELAVRLTAATTALREAAGLPALSGARVERYLAAARGLGEQAISRLWARGLIMDAKEAVALALEPPEAAETDPPGQGTGPAGAAGPAGPGATTDPRVTAGRDAGGEGAAVPPGTLTPRERQVAAFVASGRSNKAIADELFISPATAARHVANILAKLGFSSRSQIAVWAADKQLDPLSPPTTGDPPPRA